MYKKYAEDYAAELQKELGTNCISYTAIQSHIYQTWVVRCSIIVNNQESELLFPDEQSIIEHLIKEVKIREIK